MCISKSSVRLPRTHCVTLWAVTYKVTPPFDIKFYVFPESLIYRICVCFVIQWRKKFTSCSFGQSFVFVLMSIKFFVSLSEFYSTNVETFPMGLDICFDLFILKFIYISLPAVNTLLVPCKDRCVNAFTGINHCSANHTKAYTHVHVTYSLCGENNTIFNVSEYVSRCCCNSCNTVIEYIMLRKTSRLCVGGV